MPPTRKKPFLISRRLLLLFFALVLISLAEVAAIIWKVDHPRPSESTSGGRSLSAAAFDKTKYSTSSAASLWVVVNKGRVLPASYVPENLITPDVPLRTNALNPEMHLRADTAKALDTMFTAAEVQNTHLRLASGYRSYAEQAIIYNREVSTNGQTGADRESARPGHSEHQTGLAADLEPFSRNCEIDPCFADTPEGKWLAANSYKYGFIIRYQNGKEALTGYKYEPWHVRYVGVDLAAQIQRSGQTLEQFFNLPVYLTYPADSYQLKL